jgi:hypothetical protein
MRKYLTVETAETGRYRHVKGERILSVSEIVDSFCKEEGLCLVPIDDYNRMKTPDDRAERLRIAVEINVAMIRAGLTTLNFGQMVDASWELAKAHLAKSKE